MMLGRPIAINNLFIKKNVPAIITAIFHGADQDVEIDILNRSDSDT